MCDKPEGFQNPCSYELFLFNDLRLLTLLIGSTRCIIADTAAA